MINRLAIAFLLAAVIGGQAAAADHQAVVELFTSQGCSSCPKADAAIAKLAERTDVLPLAYHVGYWDYLGWKDTFGIAEATERQSAYAAVNQNRRLFTPEVIVNGVEHFVGSDVAGIGKALSSSSLGVPVSLAYEGDDLLIRIGDKDAGGKAGGTGSGEKATIRLVTFLSKAEVTIQRGENRGATIDYHNVVRSIRPIGTFEGEYLEITLPAAEVLVDGADGCAVLVQRDLPPGPGVIVGAASVLDDH